ncbi:odorant receptor 7a [Tribolium castaneum]|uniref:Odorant receptor n=1 Tax=Tribolium castaneum TaxID=7070 RepID=D6WMV4_TRICA|nr:PREDICTED: odorant receptor 7a-like [Tribolium castaneum]EFA04731.1 odorant receptor 144 [Tribolium castaneum]|eukprot:XP_015835233.1 PREDICTED: odorant receptor 7a-like [Tribolium castaneum]
MAFNESQDNFKLCFIAFNLSGLGPSSKPFLKILSYVLYPWLCLLFVLVCVNIVFKHSNIWDIGEVTSSISIAVMMVVRKTILIKYSSVFAEIIELHSRFWDYGLFGKATETKIRKKVDFFKFILKCYIVSGITATSTRSIVPIFDKNLTMPQDCWIPGNNSIVKHIIYAFQVIFYAESISYFTFFDGFLLIVTANLQAQFILLQKATGSINFETDSEETAWKKLVKCCEHHKFLISVHKKLNTLYSYFYLVTYFLVITMGCVSLFVIFDKSSTFAQLLESAITMVVLNVMIAMICICSSEIEIEAEKLLTQIYEVNWYETPNLKIRKFILFWLMQAQVSVETKGAGLLVVNRSLMLQVQRFSYSVSTLLKGMNE